MDYDELKEIPWYFIKIINGDARNVNIHCSYAGWYDFTSKSIMLDLELRVTKDGFIIDDYNVEIDSTIHESVNTIIKIIKDNLELDPIRTIEWWKQCADYSKKISIEYKLTEEQEKALYMLSKITIR